MYAVIRTGGKQYRVEPGQEVIIEKLADTESGKEVRLADVLMYSDGSKVSVGQPVLESVSVLCTCLGDELGPKLRTVKYRRRKNSRRTYGHRQQHTRLRVERIEAKA